MKSRSLFLFVNTFILILSLLTALRVLPGPDIAGVALAFYTLFVLPGFLIARLLSSGDEGLLEGLCRIFIGGLLFLTVILLLGFLPGISYRTIAMTGCVANLAMLLVVERREGGLGRKGRERARQARDSGGEGIRRTRIAAALLIFVISFVFLYGSGDTGWDSDAPDHMSYVRRAIESGTLFPGDSFHRDGDGVGFDPRKGIWHPMMALWAYQGDVPVEMLWRMMPSFVVFFALALFLLFVLSITGRPLIAPVALLFLLLFYRGEGIGWITKIGFSRNVAHIVLWGCTAFLVRYAETGRRHLLSWVFASALVGTAIHVVFVMNLAVTCFALLLYILFFRAGRPWLRRGVAAMAVAAAAVIPPLAVRIAFTSRSFNLVHTHRQGMLVLSERLAMVDPVELLARFGPAFFFALLLIPFFLWLSDGGERRKLVWMLFVVPVLIVLNPFTGGSLERAVGYLHYRILYAAPLLCYLGIGIAGLVRVLITGRREEQRERPAPPVPHRAGRNSGGLARNLALRTGRRAVAAGLLALFILLPLRLSIGTVRRSVEGILEEGATGRGIGRLLAGRIDPVVPQNSVIVSDPRTSYIVSAFTDHFVTVTLDQHCSPADTSVMRRLRETRNLFSPAVTLEESADWLLEVGADFLLVDARNERATDFFATVPAGGGVHAYEKFDACEGSMEEILSFDGFHLFRLDRDALASGAGRDCAGTAEGAVVCPGTVEGKSPPPISSYGVVLERIVTERTRIAPGDTLRGRFCWSVDRDMEYGLPFEWTIRLDGDFPRGAFYRHWYGKQYRRRVERDTGAFHRFTYSGRITSGSEQPDQWDAGIFVRQDFAVPVSERLHDGVYLMRVSIRRLSYLPNRTIGDYFLNEDSFHGVPLDSLDVRSR